MLLFIRDLLVMLGWCALAIGVGLGASWIFYILATLEGDEHRNVNLNDRKDLRTYED